MQWCLEGKIPTGDNERSQGKIIPSDDFVEGIIFSPGELSPTNALYRGKKVIFPSTTHFMSRGVA